MKMTDFQRRLKEEIPLLRRYARALTRNAVRADDLVQETLIRAVQKQHLWEAGTDLRAWIFTIMHNQHVNQIRRLTRDATVELNECSESGRDDRSDCVAPAARIRARARGAARR